jgi:hypothetical protein
MKRFHLIFGLLLVIAFLLTGQYMDRVHQHLEFMPDRPRMLYRSRHIYILLSGLLHLGIGTYFKYRVGTSRRTLQLLGSLFITAASVLFVFAFFYEPRLAGLEAPLAGNGMYLIAAGVLLHFLSGVNNKSENN